MARNPVIFIASLAFLAGCSGPIETRVQTLASATMPAQSSFAFSKKPGQTSEIYQQALILVANELETRGFSRGDAAGTLVQVALSDRPASIGIVTGKKNSKTTIANPKARKPLQSCDDNEHRLTITLTAQPSGGAIYQGTAAEFHCEGQLEKSLPHLVRAALSEFGNSADGLVQNKTMKRGGVD